MRPIAHRLLVAVALLFSAGAGSQPIGYASGTDPETARDALYRIDLGSAAATRIGYVGFRDVDGLAFHPDGTLYGAADGSNESGGTSDLLVRINPSTGAGTLAVHLDGLSGLGPGQGGQLDYGLAATCDGQLWASSDTLGTLWRVNRSTGAAQAVSSGGPPLSGLTARGQVLFGLAVDPDVALYRFDTRTSELTRVGPVTLANRIYDAGLDFDADGRLWATLDYLVPPEGAPAVFRNDLAQIDPETGAIVSLRPIIGTGSGLNTVQLEGFALAGPSCTGQGTLPGLAPVPVTASGSWSLGALALLLIAAAGAFIRRTI
jgi:hypothetical protein